MKNEAKIYDHVTTNQGIKGKTKSSKYANASINARTALGVKSVSKGNRNVNISDKAILFVKLTKIIPNWDICLTNKQKEVAHIFLTTLNTVEVDRKLDFDEGTTYNRLFGVDKNGKQGGGLGRLLEAYRRMRQDERLR